MRLLHPTGASRSKDVPDALVEKFVAGGWRKAEEPKKAPAKKAAAKPSQK